MPPAPEIRGWCPTALAPMQSGDGLLIRAHTPGSRVSATQLRAIAEISAGCGNGLVDLTQRAQLQLRGLSAATLEEARLRLGEHGLLPRDATATLNIVAGPPAWNAQPAFDTDAILLELTEQGGVHSALTRALPAKFLISIDAGGLSSLADVAADICIEALDARSAAVCVAGAPGLGAIVAAPQIAETAFSLIRAFIALRTGRIELRRMRDLVSTLGVETLLREAGVAMQPCQRRTPISVRSILGLQPLQGSVAVGVAAPFGRCRAKTLFALADIAEQCAADHVHLTHKRVFLLRARNLERANSALRAARARDFIVSRDDPRLSVVACPGAPECSQALGQTHRLAARLAPLAQTLAGPDGVGLHVSGCAKGCARAAPAPVTLVARGDGFDLIDAGGAADAPVLHALSIDRVEDALIARAEERTCLTP